jgi:hypothetical protein
MKIQLKKFGTILTSRQSGREALAAFQPTLSENKGAEDIEIDFSGVTTFSPSWGDEFLRPLDEMYKRRLFLTATDNPSVKASLEILEEANKMRFQKR